MLRLRDAVLEQGVRGAPDGAPLLSAASRSHFAALDTEFGVEAAELFGTRAALFHLDEVWCHHAAVLVEAREGIHLRSLARDSPDAEYTKIAQREFAAFLPAVADALEAALERAVEQRDVSVGALQFLRPGATWTYMVAEDPFGSPEKRLWRRASTKLRRFLT
ncbi:MAG: hypothetical protein Q7T71_08790 [Herbiconiux sp.]|nr:hypothetical protein [Herbiconiux sp.]